MEERSQENVGGVRVRLRSMFEEFEVYMVKTLVHVGVALKALRASMRASHGCGEGKPGSVRSVGVRLH